MHKEYLNLLILYMIRILTVGMESIRINKQMLKEWNVSENEVHHQKMKNMQENGYQLKTLQSIINC